MTFEREIVIDYQEFSEGNLALAPVSTIDFAAPARTAKPSDARRFAVDLIPSDAYWRDPLDVEGKIDFQALEIAEGRALQGSSLRFGLIVAGHMRWVLDWIHSASFGPQSLKNPPAEVMADEFGAEFHRIFAKSFWEGTTTYSRWMRRQDEIEGRSPRLEIARVGLTPESIRKMRQNAHQLGIGCTRGIWSRLAPVIESAFAPDGQRLKTTEQIEAEIRSIYGKDYLRPAPASLKSEDILALASGMEPQRVYHFDDEVAKIRRSQLRDTPIRPRGRPAQISDRVAWDLWQQSRLPYSQWIKRAAAEIVAESQTIPEVTLNMLSRWVQTERSRFFAHGVLVSAQDDPAVTTLTFSAVMDGTGCAVCHARDGVTRPKSDFWWSFNEPPLHHGCRCQVIPGTARENVRVSARDALPVQSNVAVGFGTMDPKAIQVTKRFNVPAPPGRAQSRALEVSGYGRRRPRRELVGIGSVYVPGAGKSYPGYLQNWR